jgi:hypothetical protein
MSSWHYFGFKENFNYEQKLIHNHSTMKSLLGNTFGAINVHIYSKVADQDIEIRTQNPKLVGSNVFVVRLAAPQLVMSIPTYIEERHM